MCFKISTLLLCIKCFVVFNKQVYSTSIYLWQLWCCISYMLYKRILIHCRGYCVAYWFSSEEINFSGISDGRAVSSTQNIQYITFGNKNVWTEYDPASNIRKSISSLAVVNNSWNRDSAESEHLTSISYISHTWLSNIEAKFLIIPELWIPSTCRSLWCYKQCALSS